MAMTPPGNHFGVLLGIALSAAVSFVVAFFILKATRAGDDSADLDASKAKSSAMKTGQSA
jgi:PTS system mannitol-specific IIC component